MVAESIHELYGRWQLDELLIQYPDLRIMPDDHRLVLRGPMPFRVVGPNGVYVEDSYNVELAFSAGFPERIPMVLECDGRIPRSYHKLVGDYLCVAAPTEIRLKLRFAPTLLGYVQGFLIPYLYGYSCFEKHGIMPYGERGHDDSGIREYIAELFNSERIEHAEDFVRCTAMKKRRANKLPCPCDSGRRLGRCHNRTVNSMRARLGRKWFQAEYARLLISLDRNPQVDAVERWLDQTPLTLQIANVDNMEKSNV